MSRSRIVVTTGALPDATLSMPAVLYDMTVFRTSSSDLYSPTVLIV